VRPSAYNTEAAGDAELLILGGASHEPLEPVTLESHRRQGLTV